MKDQDKRQTVLTLYAAGKPKKKIARLMNMDVKTVRQIVSSGNAAVSAKSRSDKIELDEVLLRSIYNRCEGYIQRVHEILSEEHGITIGYSTVVQKVRELGLGEEKSSRSCHVDDEPGEEMQNKTRRPISSR